MKKRFCFTLFMALFSAIAFATPAKRGVYKMITLADGSQVRAELRGDEHVHYWQADNGGTFVLDSTTGRYVVADVQAMVEKYQQERADIESATASSLRKAAGQKPSEPIVGERKGIVVLVQFSDVQFEEGHDVAYYDKIINTRNYSSDEGYVGSVRDYFYDQSDGELDYTFDVFGIVTLPREAAYYGGNNATGTNQQKNMKSFISSTLQSIKSEVDFSKYDNDDDGFVDNIFFIYAGLGEADGGGEDTIWPHMYYYYSGYGSWFKQNGVIVDVYACSNEVQSNGKPDGIGAICHEFSHCLGLPDMYDTGDVGNYGNDCWDVMHGGSYNGNSFIPAGYTAYERDYCGWRTLKELNDDAVYANVPGLSNGGSAYVMYNKANKNEYFIVEPRSRTGWDSALPGDGILIYHVDYKTSAWTGNTVNNEEGHQRCAIVAADNKYNTSNNQNDAYPYATNNMFTDETTPASTLFNNNSDGTKNLGCSIYDMARNSDGTYSFSFMNGTYRYDNHAPEGSLFYESFGRCAGAGGNDGTFSGAVGTDTFVADNDGWVASNKFGADKCAKFGTNKQNGAATTPEFTINGYAKISFKAASYSSECGGITLSVASGDATLADTAFKISTKNAWNDFSTIISGTGTIKLKFTGTKRWFLDEVLVMPASESDGIDDITIDSQDDGTVYNLSGQKVNADYKGVVIKKGKKFYRF